MTLEREHSLRLRIKCFTWLFILGLVLSGLTALPLETEVQQLVKYTHAGQYLDADPGVDAPAWAIWLLRVQAALRDVGENHRFLFYGTDWLAFGHFVIAAAFVGVLRHPVRNRWLFNWGLIACAAVVPYAVVLGALRGIPWWWRLIDSAFGVAGFVPLWYCRKWSREIVAALDLETEAVS
jgi:hypothetical protein